MTLTYSSSDSYQHFRLAKKNHNLITNNKFARNPSAGTSFEDIWFNGGNLSYLSSGETIDVAYSGVDNDAGTGARAVTIQGLDNNYDEIQESVTLEAGNSPMTTTQSFLRINRAFVTDTGTGLINANAITFTASTAGTVQANIGADNGQTLKSQVTIPSEHESHLTRFYANVGKGDDAEVRILIREQGKSWRVQRDLQIYQGHIAVHLDSPIVCPEKSEIKMQAKASTGTVNVAAGYDYYLLKTRF